MNMSMSLFEKNFIIGAFNLVFATLLAALLGVMLILQIKAYELNVSYSFSWRFFLFDPFASRLIGVILLAMVANIFSAVIVMSSLYSQVIESNSIIFSLTSLLWIVIYLATDYAFQTPAIFPLVILVITLIILLAHQLNRWRMKFIIYLITGVMVVLPLLGRLTDDQAKQNIPSRQLEFTQ